MAQLTCNKPNWILPLRTLNPPFLPASFPFKSVCIKQTQKFNVTTLAIQNQETQRIQPTSASAAKDDESSGKVSKIIGGRALQVVYYVTVQVLILKQIFMIKLAKFYTSISICF